MASPKLLDRITRTNVLIADGGDPTLVISPTDVGDVFAQRVARDARVLATSPGIVGTSLLPAADMATFDGPLVVEAIVSTTGEQVLARLVAMPTPDGTVVIAGVAIDDQRTALATLLLELGLALPIAVILAGVVGWWSPGRRFVRALRDPPVEVCVVLGHGG